MNQMGKSFPPLNCQIFFSNLRVNEVLINSEQWSLMEQEIDGVSEILVNETYGGHIIAKLSNFSRLDLQITCPNTHN